MEACPKCGRATEPMTRVCQGCGVIMSKVRAKTDGPSIAPGTSPAKMGRPLPKALPPTPARPAGRVVQADGPTTSPLLAFLKVGLATGAALAAFIVFSRMQKEPQSAPHMAMRPAPAPAPVAFPTPENSNEKNAPALSREDVAFLNELSSRLQGSMTATATQTEIDRIETILAGHRDNEELKTFAMSIYLRRADHDLQQGSFVLVDQVLDKMKLLDNARPEIYAFETHAKSRQGDWSGAFQAAQKYESFPGEATLAMSYTLALALEKLGRREDALAVLDRPIFQSCPAVTTPSEVGACRAAERMRAAVTAVAGSGPAVVERTRAALSVDASKEQIQSDKFDIRFDGENQSGVARDVLFVLDRAYVRLADIYYDRPTRKIPVVLHSSQDYFSKTGAPWWSGGVFSSHTGAIQIPIRGIPSTLPREMEDTLVHELSHAFVDEMAGGRAGRDLQEGLAQYMEGKRIEEELGPFELKRLANSGRQTVMTFYMLSLATTQQLVQSRGQGMVNELLRAMKETGSEDAGFRKVFGQPGTAMKRDILETFWRRYS